MVMTFDFHAGVDLLLTATDRADVFNMHNTLETDAHHAVGRPELGGREGGAGMDVVQTQKDSGQRLSIVCRHDMTIDSNFDRWPGWK